MRRPHRITFHAWESETDTMGAVVETNLAPSPMARAWAKVFYGAGAERREAAAAGSVQSATFNVRDCKALQAIDARHAIKFDNAVWGIMGISIPKLGEREFTATRLGA